MKNREYDKLIAEHSNICGYVANPDNYELLYMNDAMKQLFDITDDNYIGEKCYKIIHFRNAPCDFCTNPYLEVGEIERSDMYSGVGGGGYYSVKDTLIEDYDYDIPVKLQTSYNITREIYNIQNMTNAKGLKEATLAVSQILTGVEYKESDIALRTLLQIVCEYYDADRSYIFELDTKTRMWQNTHEFCLDEVAPNIHSMQTLPYSRFEEWYDKMKKGEDIFIHSVKREVTYNFRLYKMLVDNDIDSLILAPLGRVNQIIRFLGVDNPKKSQDDSTLLSISSAFALNDFEKRNMTQELTSKVSELQSVVSLDAAMLICAMTLLDADVDTQASMTTLLSTLCRHYHGTSAHIYELDAHKEVFQNEYEYLSGVMSDKRPIKYLSADLVNGWCNQSANGKEFHIKSIKEAVSETFKEVEMFADHGISSMMMKFLWKERKLVGILAIDNPTKNLSNLQLLNTIAAFTMNDMDKKRMNNELAEKIDELEDIISLEDAVVACATTLLDDGGNQEASIEKLLNIIADYYVSSRAYIFEIDYKKGVFYNTYEYCTDDMPSQKEALQNQPMEILDRWFELVKEEQEIYVRSVKKEVDPESMEYKALVAYDIDTIMVKPLIKENRIIGFLGVDDPTAHVGNAQLLNTVAAFTVNNLDKKYMMNELESLSDIDKLTGCYNRNHYLDRIAKLEENMPKKMGIMFIDLNHLKEVNDKIGNEYGDMLIQWGGKFLKKHIEEAIFRIGEDEFVCIATDILEKEFNSMIEKLNTKIEENKYVTLSVGSVWKSEESGKMDISGLIRKADAMIYKAKALSDTKKEELIVEKGYTEAEYLKEMKKQIIECSRSMDF